MITALSLTNFKCHKKLELAPLPRGMVKFSGNSGSGKSSSVSGISYGLFGKVWKSKSLCSYGEKVFSVSLEMLFPPYPQKWKIYRCNSPKVVKLYLDGKIHSQGDEAEEKIQELIGVTFKQYVWGIFLKGDCSILEVSPQEKYEGICSLAGVQTSSIEEKFAEIREMKKTLESKSSDLNLKIGKSQGIISSLSSEIKKMKKHLPEKVELSDMESLPELEEGLVIIDDKMREIEKSLSNFGDSARSSLEKEVAVLETKLQSVRELLMESEGYTEEYLSAAQKANEIRKAREYLEKITLTVNEENKNKKKQILSYFEKNLPEGVEPEQYRDHVRVLRERWAMYHSEIKNIEKIRAAIEKNKMILSGTLQTATKTLKDFQEFKGLKSPKTALTELRKLKKMFSPSGACPCCQTRLIYMDQKIMEADEDLEENNYDPKLLKTVSDFELSIETLLKALEIEVPDPPPKPKRSLEKAEEILSNVEVMQGQLRSLDAGRSPLITKAKSVLEILEKEYAVATIQLDPYEVSDEDLALYHNLASTNAKLKKREINISKTLEETVAKLKLGESIEALMEELIRLKESRKNLENKISERKEAEKNAKVYSDYKKLSKTIKKEKGVLEALEASKKSSLETITGLEQLKTKIKEAMLISIETTINSINSYSDFYIKKLMTTDVYIELGLSSVIEGKVVVNVYSSSSPGEIIRYDDLSDGERQRARLAFFLGINDFLGSNLKFLIIDEALNQVEESLNIKSLDLLAERPGDKIIISHEALGGKFDYHVDF